MDHHLKLLVRNIFQQIFKRGYVCGDTPYPGITKDTIIKLENGYDKLAGSSTRSLLKKHLNPKLFNKLKQIKTPTYTCNLWDCIQSGLKHLDSHVGVYAPDKEVFQVYDKLFNPIIQDIHGFRKSDYHPPKDFGDVLAFKNIDPHNNFVLSTRMRISRNLQGYPFTPKMSEEHYQDIENDIAFTLQHLKGEYRGWYFRQSETFQATQLDWIEKHLFKEPNRFMEAAQICSYLPTGRGFFHNIEKKFSVWLNFEDHLKIISMQHDGDFGQVYQRLVSAVDTIEAVHPFVRDDRLGYLTCNPKNLGTALRASVHIKLIKLPREEQLFEKALDKYGLQVRGTYGENSEVIEGVYDISNKRILGVTEFDAVKDVYDGVTEIINLEKGLKGCCNCKLNQTLYPS